MNQERYARVCELFEQCSDLAPEMRENFLNARCQDQKDLDLVDEVRRMLERDESELMSIADDDGTPPPIESSKPEIQGYVLGEILGHGGMGTVWRATQLATSREVALKIVDAVRLSSPRARSRFDREVQVCARLNDPHIAKIYDSGIADGFAYYSMELVDGIPIDVYAQRHNLSLRTRIELMAIVCGAMEHAHQRGVIHRDLKPTNILVTAEGAPRIVDFGLAKQTFDEFSDKTISMAGEIIGTPAYMAPEQAAGHVDRIDTRSDVYSLGRILFELVTGERPHDMTGNLTTVLRRTATEEIRVPRRFHDRIDRDLEAILLKSLAQEQSSRYRSAGELASDIRRYLAGQPISARTPSPLYVISKWVRANAAWATVAAAALVAMIVGTAAVIIVTKRHEQEATQLANTANQERHVAERERARAENLSYAAGIQLVAEEIANSRYRRALARLTAIPETQRGWEWHYLMGQVTATDDGLWQTTLQHGPVRKIRFSPDGRYVAGAVAQSTIEPTDNAVIVLIDAMNGQVLHALTGHTDGVFALAFTPDSKQLISGGRDRTMRRWKVETGELLETVTPTAVVDGEESPLFPFDIAMSDKYFAFSAHPAGLFICKQTDGRLPFTLQTALDNAQHVVSLPGERGQIAIDSQQSRLVWATLTWFEDEGHLYVVDLESLTVVQHHVQPPGNPITGVDIAPHGDQLLTSCFDGSAQVWRTDKLEVIHDIQGTQGMLTNARFLSDSRYVVMPGKDDLMRVWDLTRGTTTYAFLLPSQCLEGAVALNDDRTHLAAIDASGNLIRCWNVGDFQQEPNRIIAHTGKVRDSSISPDGRLVASAGEDGYVKLYDLKEDRLRWTNRSGKPYATALAFSPDGTELVVGRSENPNTTQPPWGELRFLDVATGEETREPLSIDKWVWDLQYSADARALAVGMGIPGTATAKRQGEAWVIDLPSGEVVQRVRTAGARCRGVAIGPDGGHLVTASELEVAVWSISSGKMIASQMATSGRNFVAIHDAKVVTGNEGTIEFLRYPSLEVERAFEKNRDFNDPLNLTNISDVCFTPAGDRMIAAAWDQTLTVWNCATGQPIWSFRAHRAGVHHVALSVDGTTIVSSGHDGEVKCWSLRARE